MFCFWIFCGWIFYLKTQLHYLSLPISAGGRSRVERRRSLRHRCHCYILTCFLVLFISYLYLYFFLALLPLLHPLLLPIALYLVFVFVFLCSIVAIVHPYLLPIAVYLVLVFVFLCSIVTLAASFCFVFGLCIYGWEFLWVSYIGISIFKLILRSSPSSFHSKPPLKYCSKMDRLFLLNTVCVLSRSMAYRWEPFYLVLILYSN